MVTGAAAGEATAMTGTAQAAGYAVGESRRGERGRQAATIPDGAEFPDVGYDDTADYIEPGDNDGAIADEQMNGDVHTLDNTTAITAEHAGGTDIERNHQAALEREPRRAGASRKAGSGEVTGAAQGRRGGTSDSGAGLSGWRGSGSKLKNETSLPPDAQGTTTRPTRH